MDVAIKRIILACHTRGPVACSGLFRCAPVVMTPPMVAILLLHVECRSGLGGGKRSRRWKPLLCPRSFRWRVDNPCSRTKARSRLRCEAPSAISSEPNGWDSLGVLCLLPKARGLRMPIFGRPTLARLSVPEKSPPTALCGHLLGFHLARISSETISPPSVAL